MAYLVIENFQAGLDTRKMSAASPQGSLQRLVNAHITRGGEIDKRRAMVPIYALPPGQTHGFAGADGQLYTFGSEPDVPVPAEIEYQRLVHPTASVMDDIIDVDFFDGNIFALAHYTNGDTIPFYDAVVVADLVTGGAAVVNGIPASAIFTLRDKVYGNFGSVLAFSGVQTPTDFSAAPGFGFINMSNQASGSEELTGLGLYQGLLAIFGKRNTQIWFMDPDPVQNVQRQVLDNIGTIAPKSIQSFGTADVFFLDASGIRSLRVRDSSNQANVADVGTPIDDVVTDYVVSLPEADVVKSVATIDPKDGRYLLSIADRTFAFSYFASSRISAWSEYDFGFRVDNYVTLDKQIWARGGDSLYLYGGSSGTTYDNCEVVVELPYIDGRQLATFKTFQGIDIVAEGIWSIFANFDPTNPDDWTLLANADGTTLTNLGLGMVGRSPLIKLKMVNQSDGPARLSKVVLHYVSREAN